MEIKRGSVTPVDLTGQADGDYIQKQNGVWIPRTRVQTQIELIKNASLERLPFEQMETHTSGTTRVELSGHRFQRVYAGGTVEGDRNSVAAIFTNKYAGWSVGKSIDVINWDKTAVVAVNFRIANSRPETRFWVYWGGTEDDDILDGSNNYVNPTTPCFGVRFDGVSHPESTMRGIVHDGSVFRDDVFALSIDANSRWLVMVSKAGYVEWYLNGVLIGSSNNGPTGDSASGENVIRFNVTNGNQHEAEYRPALYQVLVFTEQ